MTAAASFDSDARSHQDERCWVEWRQLLKPVAMGTRRNRTRIDRAQCLFVKLAGYLQPVANLVTPNAAVVSALLSPVTVP